MNHAISRQLLVAAAALAVLAACGREATAPRSDSAAGARPGSAVAGTGTAAHEQYAAQGIQCQACHPCGVKAAGHDASWMDQASPGFHAFSANAGVASCQSCHGALLDGIGGTTGVACAQCHGAAWKTSCVMCHGGTDNQTGAPPKAIWGSAGDPNRGGGTADPVRAGAHTSHVGATHALAQAIGCELCHVKPSDALSAGHLDGTTATVTFSGVASQQVATPPAWDRGTATCSNTYCHGGTLAGGTRRAPVWTTNDGSQRTCDACHGAPPPTSSHTRPDLDCAACHPTGYSLGAQTVAQAFHLDGKLDVELTCTSCHGTMGANAAPPLDTLGASTGLRVGAHQSHVVGKKYSSGTACQNCHANVGAYTTAHSNGVNDVAFTDVTSPSFRTGSFRPRSGSTPASCASTWCHAVKDRTGHSSGGTLQTPTWTSAITACTGCHAVPPMTGEHDKDDHRVACGYCHPGYAGTTSANATTVNLAIHVNGIRDVGGTGTRIRSWDPSTRTCLPACHDRETW